MTVSRKTIFIDTNCFIHLRDFHDLPWAELFPQDSSIELVVCRQVIRELDVHKHSQRRRLRDRSRKAQTWIERMSTEPDFRISLREKSPTLTLRLDNSSWPDGDTASLLDRTQPDDRIIAALLTETLGQPCELLSCDSGPLVLARRLNVTAHRPPDAWYLPDGNDADRREIEHLKRELTAALATRPSIAAGFLQKGMISDAVQVRVPVLPPLSPKVCESLMAEVQKRYPKEGLPESMRPTMFVLDGDPSSRFTSSQAQRYGGAYGRFLDECQQYFETLHQKVTQRAHAARVAYRLSNSTAITAMNLLVEFECDGDVLVGDDEEDVEILVGKLELPAAPKRPKTDHERLISTPFDYASFREKPRDPTGFYWQDRPSVDSAHGSLICKEFRARESVDLDFFIVPYKGAPFEGEIRLKVSATNLPDPLHVNAVIRIDKVDTSWADEEVLALLDPWVAPLVAGA